MKTTGTFSVYRHWGCSLSRGLTWAENDDGGDEGGQGGMRRKACTRQRSIDIQGYKHITEDTTCCTSSVVMKEYKTRAVNVDTFIVLLNWRMASPRKPKVPMVQSQDSARLCSKHMVQCGAMLLVKDCVTL
jgi:hypothetical protein